MNRMDTPNPHTPARLHMIWFGPEKIPQKYVENSRLWQNAYPHCDFRLWDEDSYRREITSTNAALFREAAKIKPNDAHRLRADIARLDILYEFGGLYIDCDSEPRGDMSDLIGEHAFVAGRSPQHINGVHPIANGVIAAAAGHPFLLEAINGLAQSVSAYRDRSVAQMVGPWHLTRTYNEHPELHDQMHILEPGKLYDGTYLVHHWDNAKRRAAKRRAR